MSHQSLANKNLANEMLKFDEEVAVHRTAWSKCPREREREKPRKKDALPNNK